MIIGIDASRAFIKNRTGIEEYSYQVIRHMANYLKNDHVVLYIRKKQIIDFKLPENWKIKIIKFPYLWTQVGLSLEMFLRPVDVLFIPAHTVPIIHPENTIVTIHGLEYEFCPEAYSWWERFYMRLSIKNSCRWAKKIIAVSENTKKDLIKLYKVEEGKIQVIYEGYNRNFQFPRFAARRAISNFQSSNNFQNSNLKIDSKFIRRGGQNSKFLLFIGRLEERKNIMGIIEAYKILVEKYEVPHALVLAGAPGHGYEIIKLKIENYLKIKNSKLKIIELGYVDEAQKWDLLSSAEAFIFPTLYEGFGIPILEAQSVGTPVVAGDNSSIREIITISPSHQMRRGLGRGDDAGEQHLPFNSPPQLRRGGLESAILVDPMNAEQIADAAYDLISDKTLRDDIIKKGYENVKRFSWDKCGKEIAQVLTG